MEHEKKALWLIWVNNQMERKNINDIKKLESKPKIINIFSEEEIKMIQKLYLFYRYIF